MSDHNKQSWSDPNSLFAYFVLGYISMAGIYYVNVIPVLVGTLIDGLGFAESQAGYVASANVYGATLGALIAVLVIKLCPWKKLTYAGIAVFATMDLLSAWVTSFEILIVMRFVSGIFGGMVAGCVIGVMARVENPTRAYGIMLICHFSLGGAGLYLLPDLVPYFGATGMFLALMTIALTAMLLTRFAAEYPIPENSGETLSEGESKTAVRFMIALALISLFIFQGSNMEVFSYLQRLGLFVGLPMEWVSRSLALGLWVGIAGAVLAAVIGVRFGRTWLIVAASSVSALSILAFHRAANAELFMLANMTFQIAWAFLLSYLFGICADLDTSGRLAATGGVMSKLGLSTGPFIAASIVTGDNYDLILRVGFFGILLCALCTIFPARYLDRKKAMIGAGVVSSVQQ